MKKIPLTKILLLFLAVLSVVCPAQAEDIKQIHPTGYVTDLANVITPATKARLEALCTELQQKTGAQLAIITVHSLEGESVEDYAVDLFKQLGIGSKKDNRGVLLLLAPDERKYRVEIGYGLEPVINDARAGDAGRAMVPLLRQQNYSAAAEMGAWQLAKYIADDAGVTLSGQPPVRPVRYTSHHIGFAWIFLWGFLLLLFLATVGGGRRGGGGVGSAGLWGVLGFILGNALGSSSGESRGRGWDGGGFGGGSGGWSGGGGGFGGFGGGSSGGGGASGSW